MMVQGDAKGLEWRTIVILSDDKTGIDEIQAGADTHELNRVEFKLPTRLISKIYLFRTIFRGSGWAFANDANFSHVSNDPKYWDNVNDMFFAKYSGIERKHGEWFSNAARREPIVGPTGSSWLINPRHNGEIDRNAASNYPVQGTGADIVATARVTIRNRIRRREKKDWLMVSSVHDSIVLDVPDQDVQEAANLIYESFDALQGNLKKLFNWDVPVPLPAEVKVGHNLTEMTELSHAS
jgi:hypothetical protein